MDQDYKDYLTQVARAEATIDDMLDGLVLDVMDIMDSKRQLGGAERDKTETRVIEALAAFFIAYEVFLKKHLVMVNAIGVFSNFEGNVDLLKSFDIKLVDDYQKTLKLKLAQFDKTIPHRKHPLSGKTYPQTIKTVKEGTTRTVRDIVQVGVSQGKSAFDIAKDIEPYIKPEGVKSYIKPNSWHADRIGFKSTKAGGEPIPQGSVSYNAHRIARSEGNLVYRDAVLSKNNPWVKGYNWVLSANHPAPDICDDWAAASPYDDISKVPIDHPNGLCRIEEILMTGDEFAQWAKNNL